MTGISSSNQIEFDQPPKPIIKPLKKVMAEGSRGFSPLGPPKKSSADCFTYKVTIQNGTNEYTIESDELHLQDNLKSLIKYVQLNSK